MSSMISNLHSVMLNLPPFPAEHMIQQQQSLPLHHSSAVNNNHSNVNNILHNSSSSSSSWLFSNNSDTLPNYEYEITQLKVLLVTSIIIWLLVVPYLILYRRYKTRRNVTTTKISSNDPLQDTTQNTTRSSRSRYLYYCLIVPITTFCCFMGCIITMIALIGCMSPYNYYQSRRVFQTPLLTPQECQHIIDTSMNTAQENIIKLKKYHPDDYSDEERQLMYDEPIGWQKVRHEKYPTTDLNLVTDPFPFHFQLWLRDICDQRISPLLSRIYGIPIRSIEARDMFVVRYDSDLSRIQLKKHTDGGDLSFTIVLNNNFEGGGTQFWNRHLDEPFYLLQENVDIGHMSAFSGRIEHEGYPITSGQRMILVGFLDVKEYDEDDRSSTGLSIFASWLNINWAITRFTRILLENKSWNKFWRKKAAIVLTKVQDMVDQYATHAVVPPFIESEHLVEFLDVLEQSYNQTNRWNKARWLEGQQKKAFLNFVDDLFSTDDDDENDEDYNENEAENADQDITNEKGGDEL